MFLSNYQKELIDYKILKDSNERNGFMILENNYS